MKPVEFNETAAIDPAAVAQRCTDVRAGTTIYVGFAASGIA